MLSTICRYDALLSFDLHLLCDQFQLWHSDSPDSTCSSIWRQHCACCMPNANITSRTLFGSFHTLAGIPGHHLKLAHSPHWWGKTFPVQDSMFGSVFESMCFFWCCLTCDRFPCIARSIISAPTNFIQSRLYLVIIKKSSPIPTICSGIHWIEPSFCCANAFQAASKYDVVVRRASTFPLCQVKVGSFGFSTPVRRDGCVGLLVNTDFVRQWQDWCTLLCSSSPRFRGVLKTLERISWVFNDDDWWWWWFYYSRIKERQETGERMSG
jgi:hypothetical protein